MRTIPVLLLAAALGAADATPTADAETRRRAEAAMAELAQAQAPLPPLDPALAARLTDAAAYLTAGEQQIAGGDGARAGDLWLKASTILRTLTKEERALIGPRLKPVEDAALRLARRLVDADAVGK